jgi:hypothetical protein
MPARSILMVALVASVVWLWMGAALAADTAIVTFALDFPGSDPAHYSIAVQSDGRGSYECVGRISQESDETENYQAEFSFSDSTRARIFELAAQANYFSGPIDAGKKKLAFTGTKKLSYKDGQRDTAGNYNFSSIPAVQQLTALFQSVAATMEFGRRLEHYHRYQKLALDDELERMELQARDGQLSELPAVKPVLKEIYNDPSVMNVVRARAQRIIAMGSLASAGH